MKAKKTKFAVIGDPVGHSLSPAMHNAAFRALDLPFRYSKILLKAPELHDFFKRLPRMEFGGLNVTVPHKEVVMRFLKSYSPEARWIGAANTIALTPRGPKGFNTDGVGYLASLKEESGFSPRGKNVVILGAGGAARAILAALLKAGAGKVTIANRTLSKARALKKEFSGKFPKTFLEAKTLKSRDLSAAFEETDLLVNASSAGMDERSPLPPLPLSKLRSSALVSDIVYCPPETPLLRHARKLGLKTHGGLGMLLHQGALSFEIWTKRKAPLSVMRRALLSALKKQQKSHP